MKKFCTTSLIGCTLLLVLTLGKAYAAGKIPDCKCRDQQGQMRSLGFVDCININGTEYLVRCEMSLNNPFWARLHEGGCPTA